MNFKLSIASDKDEHMKAALEMFRLEKMVGYRVCNNTLYIYRRKEEGLEKIPFPSTNVAYLINLIKSWLSTAQYPEEPDCDGSVGKGFEMFIYNYSTYCDMVEENVEVNDHGWAISIVVKPYWTEYHK
jgi:hypothetical protein